MLTMCRPCRPRQHPPRRSGSIPRHVERRFASAAVTHVDPLAALARVLAIADSAWPLSPTAVDRDLRCWWVLREPVLRVGAAPCRASGVVSTAETLRAAAAASITSFLRRPPTRQLTHSGDRRHARSCPQLVHRGHRQAEPVRQQPPGTSHQARGRETLPCGTEARGYRLAVGQAEQVRVKSHIVVLHRRGQRALSRLAFDRAGQDNERRDALRTCLLAVSVSATVGVIWM